MCDANLSQAILDVLARTAGTRIANHDLIFAHGLCARLFPLTVFWTGIHGSRVRHLVRFSVTPGCCTDLQNISRDVLLPCCNQGHEKGVATLCGLDGDSGRDVGLHAAVMTSELAKYLGKIVYGKWSLSRKRINPAQGKCTMRFCFLQC